MGESGRILGLKCIDCSSEFERDYILECRKCGGLLKVAYDVGHLKGLDRNGLTGDNLWRYRDFLPIVDRKHFVTLGEGITPLLRCPNLERRLDLKSLYIKFDGVNPTGTVKDRSSATAVAAALEFGFHICSVVSTGNAGSSIASYASRAGLRSLIFCYEEGARPKMSHMDACSTDLVIYRGVYDDIIQVFDQMVDEGRVFDCGASRNPYKQEGKKTVALEICEQMGWRVPDYVIIPGAVGEIFISSWGGFNLLMDAGWTERLPRLVLAQAARANPISRAFKEGSKIVPQKIGYTVAEGLAVGDPGKKGDWTLRTVRESDGLAEDVTDEEIMEAQRILAREEGIWAGPTGVSSVAALIKLLQQNRLPRDAKIVCVVTETGLKGEYPPLEKTAILPDVDLFRSIIEGG